MWFGGENLRAHCTCPRSNRKWARTLQFRTSGLEPTQALSLGIKKKKKKRKERKKGRETETQRKKKRKKRKKKICVPSSGHFGNYHFNLHWTRGRSVCVCVKSPGFIYKLHVST